MPDFYNLPTFRNTTSGWTASAIAPHGPTQDASHSVLAPSPEQKDALSAVTNHILGLTPQTPVGSASVFENAGVPATIQAAIQNLNTNTQISSFADILQKVLGNFQGGGQVQVQTPEQKALNQAQTQYYQAKTATMNAPAIVGNQISTLEAQKQKMGATPFGGYEGSPQQKIDQQLTSLYGQQTGAQQAAFSTGWTPSYAPAGVAAPMTRGFAPVALPTR